MPCTVDDGQIIDEPDPAHPAFQKSVTFDVELPVPDAGLPTTCPDGSGLAAVSITVGGADTTDPVPGNDTAISPVPTIGTFADLGLEMTDMPATLSIGQNFDVTVTVTNHGPCDAPDVLADDEQALTSLNLVFLSADGACTTNPTQDTCVLGTVPATETRVWNLHYKMGDFPPTLISSDEPLSVTVFRDPDAATDPIDPNPDNDFAQTKSFVKKSSVGSCSTGGMGDALSLLVLAVPFALRRRRKARASASTMGPGCAVAARALCRFHDPRPGDHRGTSPASPSARRRARSSRPCSAAAPVPTTPTSAPGYRRRRGVHARAPGLGPARHRSRRPVRPRSAVLSDLEQKLADLATQRKAPLAEKDGQLCALADTFMGWKEDGQVPAQLAAAVAQHLGIPFRPEVRLATFDTSDPRTSRRPWSTRWPTSCQRRQAPRFGLVMELMRTGTVRARKERARVTLALLDAPVTFQPFPRKLDAGASATVAGEVLGD